VTDKQIDRPRNGNINTKGEIASTATSPNNKLNTSLILNTMTLAEMLQVLKAQVQVQVQVQVLRSQVQVQV